jgi:hypothetical protein
MQIGRKLSSEQHPFENKKGAGDSGALAISRSLQEQVSCLQLKTKD